jgi:nicotinamidase-related amidase
MPEAQLLVELRRKFIVGIDDHQVSGDVGPGGPEDGIGYQAAAQWLALASRDVGQVVVAGDASEFCIDTTVPGAEIVLG